MKKTKIEWCDSTINPVVGCTYGCQYCYARKMNQRFSWIDDFFKPQFFPERLKQLNQKKPQVIFMNSMSDIADWQEEWLEATLDAIELNPQHQYMFLTKRIHDISRSTSRSVERLKNIENVWLGITVTNNEDMANNSYEIYRLWSTKCKKFVSFEPLHEHIKSDFMWYLSVLDWFIIGAETGNRKEKIIPKYDWLKNILSTAVSQDIPVFIKESLFPIIGEGNMLREFPKCFIAPQESAEGKENGKRK